MSPRPHPYTRRVVRLVDLARKESSRLEHKHIGPEHLLLALLREEGGAAALVLHDLHVNVGHLHRMACSVLTRSTAHPVSASELTPVARRAIDLAEEEARRLGHGFIGSEHVLLGLLRADQGAAAWVLQHAGVTLDATRARVQQIQTSGRRFDNSLADRDTARTFRTQVAPRAGYPYQPSEAAPLTPGSFSPAARIILSAARTAAQRRQQTAIGPEHVLLALLERRDDIPARVLTSLGADLARLRAALGCAAGRGGTMPAVAPALTSHARAVVETAANEARLRQTQVLPAHFLLALAHEREGVAIAALRGAGLEPERVYARTSAALLSKEQKQA